MPDPKIADVAKGDCVSVLSATTTTLLQLPFSSPYMQWSIARVLLPDLTRALQPLLRPVRVLSGRHVHRSDKPSVSGGSWSAGRAAVVSFVLFDFIFFPSSSLAWTELGLIRSSSEKVG